LARAVQTLTSSALFLRCISTAITLLPVWVVSEILLPFIRGPLSTPSSLSWEVNWFIAQEGLGALGVDFSDSSALESYATISTYKYTIACLGVCPSSSEKSVLILILLPRQ
jgi:hypothetical protein